MQAGTSPAPEERRGSTRREVAWRVLVLRACGDRHLATCTDIGESGVGFHADCVLRVGEIVDLEFPGAAGDGVDAHPAVRAQIIYRIGDRYGASFVNDRT